ncbi:MAG: YbjN domain-containing protein [Pseudomonadota bacterium]
MALVDLSGESELSINPLDILEELITANDWRFERHNDSELTVEMAGQWCTYHMYFVWQDDLSAIFFSCHFDVRVVEAQRPRVYELVGRVNERLWLGHFDLLAEQETTIYRQTIPMRGQREVSAEQLEDLVDTAMFECERFYPALQSVVWSGLSVPDALAAAIMDTVGEA